jgi:hypothetical protein
MTSIDNMTSGDLAKLKIAAWARFWRNEAKSKESGRGRPRRRAPPAGANAAGWSGHHIGWWQDGHMRENRGAVVVFRRDATNLIVGRPGLGAVTS